MASAISYEKPELSTLRENGTFYFALTVYRFDVPVLLRRKEIACRRSRESHSAISIRCGTNCLQFLATFDELRSARNGRRLPQSLSP
jgi:hypothetical protein